MRRARKIALWITGITLTLPVALVILVLIAGNLQPVRTFAEHEINSATSGMVRVAGLHGRFPDALRLDSVQIADAKGVWLRADGVTLDWSPSALLGLRARIDLASVSHLSVARKPVPAAATPAPAGRSSGFSLPVSVDVRALRIDRADIAAPVAGSAFALNVNGNAFLRTTTDGKAALIVTRQDGLGTYRVDAIFNPATVAGHVSIQEPDGGLIASIGQLHGLGAISVTGAVDGPLDALQANLSATAGPLRVALRATANVPAQHGTLDLDATAPEMHPRPNIGWASIDVHAHAAGAFTTPDATAHVAIARLAAGAASIETIAADMQGNRGGLQLHAVLTGTHIPGKKPDLLAAAPLDIRSDINLAAPTRPANVHVMHPLLALDGSAETAGNITATLHAVLPDLAPLAAAGGADVQGTGDFTAHVAPEGTARSIAVTGTATITGGATLPPGLRGPAKLDVLAIQDGANIDLRHATIDAASLHLAASGPVHPDALNIKFHTTLPNLAAFAPKALGAIDITGTASGPQNDLTVIADVSGQAGSAQYPKAPLSITLNATHLPAAPQAHVAAKLRFAGADARLDANVKTDAAGTINAVLNNADWKSFTARADTKLPRGGQPEGKLNLTIGSLADIAQFTGQPLAGRLTAVADLGRDAATIKIDGNALAAGPRHIDALALNGRATGANTNPDLDATLTLAGIDADGVTGAATVTARGKQAALQLTANATLQTPDTTQAGARIPATITTTALLNARAKQATLQTFTADWQTLAVRLQGATRIDFGPRTAVDRLKLAVNQATIEAAGQFGPTLDLTARVRNLTPELAKPFAPTLQAAGIVSADAHLTGTTTSPSGTIHVTAAGLKLRTGPAASLPAANIRATADLAAGTARLDAHVDAGTKLRLALTGTAPLNPTGALALHTDGALDLTILNPIMQAEGRNLRGRAQLNVAVSGTAQAPRATGAITLVNAEIQDYAQGLQLDKINGEIDATGDSFTISHLGAGAGAGSIAINGTIGAFAPGIPVDLHITAHNARPLSSDLLTAYFDSDLHVHGQATVAMDATGTVLLHRVEIHIPDGMPPNVAVLNVRRPGQAIPKPPPANAPPAPPAATVRLAIDVDAPSNMFVRGKGLYAELGGTLHIHGTTAAPQITGGFDMRRGDFSLAGTTLQFTKGSVSFNGTGVTGRIDPSLDFEADSPSNGITAILKVTGYASAPKIALSSVPDLPQDEVLAHLLFGVSMKDLSPLQIAQIGAALAELSGAVGSEGPLGAIRKGLGLDRLSVGGGAGGPTVEAGRYVAKGVYVGTKQSTGGAGGTQVEVQIDLTRRIKLKSTLGSGGGSAQGATPDTDPGSTLGLSYQFEY
jgi:translocation and assembly module TamB